MSAQGLQHVVCRGAIDRDFLQLLARAPSAALIGFDLDADEAAMVMTLDARTLEDLARGVEAWRRGDPDPERAPVRRRSAAPMALAG